jgi:hypothetical protein
MINQQNVNRIRKYAVKSFYFKTYLLLKLPMGFISGMRIRELNEEKCRVTVPFKWLNKNPFKSTFWAVLGMAAEMNSAALILQYTYKHQPSISTLPIKSEALFLKKATGLTTFTCDDSKMIKDQVEIAIKSGKSVTIKTNSIGRDNNGDEICHFKFDWSLKIRNK